MKSMSLFAIAIFGLATHAEMPPPTSKSPVKVSVMRTWYDGSNQGAMNSDAPCKDVAAEVSVYEQVDGPPNQPLLVYECKTELKNGEPVTLMIFGEKTVNEKTGYTYIDFNYRYKTSPKSQHLGGAAVFYPVKNGETGYAYLSGTTNEDENLDGTTQFNIYVNY